MDFNLGSLGWKSFEDLAVTIARHEYDVRALSFAAGKDAGRDGGGFTRAEVSEGTDLLAVTIQCKHSSTGATLTAKSFANELPKIRKLVGQSLCNTYFLFTNLRLSAVSESAIRRQVIAQGVETVHIIGKETIEQLLTENKELRGLVPRA